MVQTEGADARRAARRSPGDVSRFLYDTAIFAYAVGGAHRYQEPCRQIVAMAGREELLGEASADLVQELLHQRFRRTGDRRLAANQAREVAALCVLHEVRAADVERGLELFEGATRLSARDAVFAALALNREIETILSPDRDFDEVAGLRRVDPLDEAALGTLAASG